jgi:uncharacterized protein
MAPPNFRRCMSCRTLKHRSSLMRIVRQASTGGIQLDQGMGRSAYLCPTAACLQQAQRKKRIERSLRTAIPEQVYATLWARIEVPLLDSVDR